MEAITHYIVRGKDDDGGDLFITESTTYPNFGWGTSSSRTSAHEFLSEAAARAARGELLGDGVILRIHPDGTDEAVYGCVLGTCRLHDGEGCKLGHAPAVLCSWQRGQPPTKGLRRAEGLEMFCVFTPFQGMIGAILDLNGRWPESLLAEPPENAEARLRNPTWTGCAVWEGTATEQESDEQKVVRWTLEGRWRHPTYVEMRRLAEGRFPLRREALPESSKLMPFGTKE